MKKMLKNQNFIALISVVTLLCLAGITYAASNSSSIKIGRTVYSPAMSAGSPIPPVICNVVSSGSDGANLLISFVSGKRAGKTAFVNLNFNFSPSDYNSLMTGDTIDFQQSSDFTSLIGQKVFFIFSEGSVKKTRTKITSISESQPSGADSSYSLMGSVKILDKRADGCLDVSFNAVAQNASVNKVITTIDPAMDCIEGTTSEKLRTVPSVSISGNLYPEKFSGNRSNGSGSTSMLCNASSSSSSSTGGNSSGFIIPGFGSSSGSNGIPGLPNIPGIFGTSSGIFNFPDIPDEDTL